MEVPFLQVPNLEKRAEELRQILTRVVVSDVLEYIDVTSTLTIQPQREFTYTVRFNFLPRECYKSEFCVKPKQILKHMRKRFFAEMFTAIMKYSKIKSNL